MTDLDEAADELYAGAPEGFVARRAELVRQARARQDRSSASAIQALRRPTRAAWLVNLLARSATVDLTALLDLAPILRDAQVRGDGAALRELSTQRRRSIDRLTRRARELGREHQHPPAEASLGEVAATLQAALADPEIAEQVRRGRLATAVVYGGFGSAAAPTGEDLSAALTASIPSRAAPAQRDRRDEDEPSRHEQAEHQREDQRRAELRRAELARRRDQARTALAQARAETDEATEHADALGQQVERFRDELARTEQAEQQAQQAARTARERVRERRSALDAAEHAWREEEADRP